MTMSLVSTVTVGSSGTPIQFSSIPQTGTDLYLVVNARNNGTYSGDAGLFYFNGNFSNYSWRKLSGSGSAVASTSATAQGWIEFPVPISTATANTFGSVAIYIPNYTAAVNKSVSVDAVTENNGTAAAQVLVAGLWASTAAINQINFDTGNGMLAGSTISLYIITKGSGGATVS